MEVQAQLRWSRDDQFVARCPGAPAVVIDNPETGSAAGPMQLLLMGTAGCSATDVISILKRKEMAVTGFTVNVSGTIADKHPRRYTDIHIEYVISGTDISPKGVEQAIKLSVTKFCGAVASLNATITTSYRIVPPESVLHQEPFKYIGKTC